jgi:endoglucanase
VRRLRWGVAVLACMAVGASCAQGSQAQSGQAAIQVDQLGYLPGAHKLALVEGMEGGGFQVVDEAGVEVFAGPLSASREWSASGRLSALADFSPLARPGRYRLRVAGVESDAFPIQAQAYAGLADAALKAYYHARSGTALEAAHAGRHARAAGHPDTQVEIHPSAASARRPAGSVVAAPKGWYDAGDYNKYVVNSGITTWTLLAAFEHFPGFWSTRELGIPESGNAVPDILDEIWWNLQWLLAMQDPADGSVYHKLTTLSFEGDVMPHQANARRYMVGKGTAAALDFAAVMATASRVYAPYEQQFPGVPARMRLAAEAAWAWAQANPDQAYVQPEDVHTGAYGDGSFSDEFAWAAAELYLLTGQDRYLQAFDRHATAISVPNWADVGALGRVSLAQHRQRLPAALADGVQASLTAAADPLLARWQASAGGLAMDDAEFRWGSNAQVLNQALLLLQGYRLEGRREYLDAAQSHLDYVLGRNPLGLSFVTGHGLRTPQAIHHRPSQADGIDEPLPGLLSGGPNPGQQDKVHCPEGIYTSSRPALSWIDHPCSYASNEIAINWNAPLVYVAAAIQVLTPP